MGIVEAAVKSGTSHSPDKALWKAAKPGHQHTKLCVSFVAPASIRLQFLRPLLGSGIHHQTSTMTTPSGHQTGRRSISWEEIVPKEGNDKVDELWVPKRSTVDSQLVSPPGSPKHRSIISCGLDETESPPPPQNLRLSVKPLRRVSTRHASIAKPIIGEKRKDRDHDSDAEEDDIVRSVGRQKRRARPANSTFW